MSLFERVKYKDIWFETKMEAQWAVYFDELGADWEYRPEIFDLDLYKYKPDFLIHNCNFLTTRGWETFDLWIEVREYPTFESCVVVDLFAYGDQETRQEAYKEELQRLIDEKQGLSTCINLNCPVSNRILIVGALPPPTATLWDWVTERYQSRKYGWALYNDQTVFNTRRRNYDSYLFPCKSENGIQLVPPDELDDLTEEELKETIEALRTAQNYQFEK